MHHPPSIINQCYLPPKVRVRRFASPARYDYAPCAPRAYAPYALCAHALCAHAPYEFAPIRWATPPYRGHKAKYARGPYAHALHARAPWMDALVWCCTHSWILYIYT